MGIRAWVSRVRCCASGGGGWLVGRCGDWGRRWRRGGDGGRHAAGLVQTAAATAAGGLGALRLCRTEGAWAVQKAQPFIRRAKTGA